MSRKIVIYVRNGTVELVKSTGETKCVIVDYDNQEEFPDQTMIDVEVDAQGVSSVHAQFFIPKGP